MHSYGLKPSNTADVKEGKRIVEAMQDADKYAWEEEQKEQAGKK